MPTTLCRVRCEMVDTLRSAHPTNSGTLRGSRGHGENIQILSLQQQPHLGRRSPWPSVCPGKPDIAIGSPPEFKGEADVWAPEEMLVAALNSCMMLTFVAFAQGKKLAFVGYESTAEGLLENVDGKYRIVEVNVQPIVVLSSEADISAARTIMAEVKANCFISNSITADVKLAPQFKLASDVAG